LLVGMNSVFWRSINTFFIFGCWLLLEKNSVCPKEWWLCRTEGGGCSPQPTGSSAMGSIEQAVPTVATSSRLYILVTVTVKLTAALFRRWKMFYLISMLQVRPLWLRPATLSTADSAQHQTNVRSVSDIRNIAQRRNRPLSELCW